MISYVLALNITTDLARKLKSSSTAYDVNGISSSSLDCKIEMDDEWYLIYQKSYISNPNALNCTSNSPLFPIFSEEIEWATDYRPNISCSVALINQVTQEHFERDRNDFMKKTNVTVHHLSRYSDIAPHSPHLKNFAQTSGLFRCIASTYSW